MNNSSIRNFSYLTVGQVTATIFHALFYIGFATILDPEVYGEMVYWIAIAGFASVIARFGMPYSVTVYQAKEKTSLVNQVNTFVIISSSIAALVLIPINIFAAFLSLGLSIFYMNQHNLLGLKKYKRLSTALIIRSGLFISLPILFFYVFDTAGILLGLIFANIIPSFDYLKLITKNVNSFHDLKQNFKVLINNFAVDLSTILPGTIDKLIIVPILGFAMVGYYQFNLQILTALSILPILVHGYLLTEESSKKIHNNLIYFVIIGTIILIISTIILSPYIIETFFPKFIDGVFSLQILSITLLPMSVGYMLKAKLQAEESIYVGYSLLIQISSLVVLLYFLGITYNLFGLSIAILISNILHTSFLGFLFYKQKIFLK